MSRPEVKVDTADWSRDHDAIARVRERVFVKEQGVPIALEWDGLDETAVHLIARSGDDQIIGTARLLPSGQIGRMAVLASHRRMGIGRALLERLLEIARAAGHEKLFLNAQVQVTALYAQTGFTAVGDEFDEAGIPHRRMELRL